tara:strand:- start:1599 stop:1700 length:102 start_codon:yes stop_codon:yes gene_type:complete
MITNILLAGILLVLLFMAVMLYAIGEKLSESKK